MRKHDIINVLKPGPVSLGRVDISGREKLMLYQLHDINPRCVVSELALHVDVPQTQIVPTLRVLAAHGYIRQRGEILDVYDTPQDGALPQKTNVVPYREECMEMAEELAPKLAAAYHLNDYNKYSLGYSLVQLVNLHHVDIEKLRRACRWIGEHAIDPYFPVLQSPHMIVSQWGRIVRYKRQYDERQVKAKVIL